MLLSHSTVSDSPLARNRSSRSIVTEPGAASAAQLSRSFKFRNRRRQSHIQLKCWTHKVYTLHQTHSGDTCQITCKGPLSFDLRQGSSMPRRLLQPSPSLRHQRRPCASIQASFGLFQDCQEGDCPAVSEQIGRQCEFQDILDFSWTEVAWVDTDNHFARGGIDTLLINTLALPTTTYMRSTASRWVQHQPNLGSNDSECLLNEFAHGVNLPRSQNEILRCFLLKNQPHSLCVNVITRTDWKETGFILPT